MKDYDELDRMRTRRQSGSRRRMEETEAIEVEPIRTHAAGRRKRKKRILIIELIVLVILLFGIYFFFKEKNDSGYWTIAVFGVDSRDGSLEKGALSDVEMLCVIDKATGEMKLVSVYRDTYLQIDAKGTYHKINEAYFKGGHEQAVSALERNLDLKIDNYATFNWKAVADVINILGGIDLEISDSEFKYINGFITETVNSTGIGSYQLKNAGMNHLDGVQAVAYARLRLMDTDYNRTARQRKVISLAMDKAKQADFAALNNILVTVLPQISTDIGIGELIPMAQNIGKYYLGTTEGFPFSRGETKIGKKDCVIPLTLESNVVQLHELLYGVEEYRPSAAVKSISAKIASDSGMGEVAENAPKATAGGSGGGKGKDSAPAPTAPPETVPEVESSTEETTEETTEAETIEESAMESTTSTEESSSEEKGPGVERPSESSKNPDTPNETVNDVPETPGETSETSVTPEKPGSPENPGTPGESLQQPSDKPEQTEPLTQASNETSESAGNHD